MKIYDKTKTIELKNPDLKKGSLSPDKILVETIPAQEEVLEQSHMVLVAEYPNGGKDFDKVIDVPYQPARQERKIYENILIYTPFDEKYLLQRQIAGIKQWFLEFYTYKEQKYRRLIELNLNDGNTSPKEELEQLYLTAEIKRKEIQDLELKLNAMEN